MSTDRATERVNILNLKSKWRIFFGITSLRVSLDFIYYEYISTIFRYEGFASEFNVYRYMLSWIILLIFIPIFICLYNNVSFSSVILIFIGCLSIVPYTTMIAYYPFSLSYIVQNTLYWLILFWLYGKIPTLKVGKIKNDKFVNLIIAIIITIFLLTIIYISWRYTGFRVTFDIFNVYDLRSEARSFNLPNIITYIYSASKAVNPVLIVYFLYRKKNKIALIIFLAQILSFSINGAKTVLFSTFLALLLFWFYSNRYLYRIPWILTFFCILSSMEVIFNKTFMLVNFIIRRIFFLPNLLSFCYFDFFSVNRPDYFKQSFLRHFGIQSDYINIPNLIGEMYFNRPSMAANNGFISDAYANLGWLGLIIMPIIIVLALRLLDICSKGLNIKIFIISAITLSFIFISSFFFTMLFTHGFIAVCLILYLLPREDGLARLNNVGG